MHGAQLLLPPPYNARQGFALSVGLYRLSSGALLEPRTLAIDPTKRLLLATTPVHKGWEDLEAESIETNASRMSELMKPTSRNQYTLWTSWVDNDCINPIGFGRFGGFVAWGGIYMPRAHGPRQICVILENPELSQQNTLK